MKLRDDLSTLRERQIRYFKERRVIDQGWPVSLPARNVGLSSDGTTYTLPEGHVHLGNCAWEIVTFMIEKLRQGIRDVPKTEIEDRINQITGINVAALRDRMGGSSAKSRSAWKKLFENGARRGTVRLKHPPTVR